MARVVLENIFKVYKDAKGKEVKAVNNANLVIEDKEFVVLVGPSGCGKSTTLRMIAGLEEISEGTISIDGKIVNDVPPKDRDIAMVFQNYALYPHMSVYENMAFGLKLRKFPKSEIENRVRDTAKILGLTDDQLQRKPKELSGGQRQRVAVGRAIVRQPKAFLFDEPLSNLDAKMRVQMRTEISKLHDQLNSTMIYVTHDQVEAMTMGDRIVVMKDGVIQQVAPPLELYDDPTNEFVAGFIGSPPMNFFAGSIQQKNGAVTFVEDSKKNPGFTLKLSEAQAARLKPYINQPVKMGIRPENINDQALMSESVTDNIVPALVEVVEPMGAEVYLYLNTGNHSFVARVNSREHARPHQKLNMVFNAIRFHFFDTTSGNAIK